MPQENNRKGRDDKSGDKKSERPYKSGANEGKKSSSNQRFSDQKFSTSKRDAQSSGTKRWDASKDFKGKTTEGKSGFGGKSYDKRAASERKPFDKTKNNFGEKRDNDFNPDRKDVSFKKSSYGEQSKKSSYHDRKPGFGSRSKSGFSERPAYGDKPLRSSADDKTGYKRSRTETDRKTAFGDKPLRNNPDNRKPFRGESKERQKPEDRSYKNYRDQRSESSSKRASKPNDDQYRNSSEKTSRRKLSEKPYKNTESENAAEINAATEKDESGVRLRRGDFKKSFEKEEETIRLNKYIANSGICSRRKADELIIAGVISVNGEVISSLGAKVNPSKDQIRYNGELLKREKMVYVLLNKPKDYITTTDDPHERKTVMQLVDKASRERIYPVGRLDRNTTGLLLMTNDGDLAEKLSHPRNNITKIYQAELNKNLTQGDFNKIAFGLELEDGLIKPDAVSYVQGGAKNEIGIQIHSGKNRIVRRIFEHLGYEVDKLDRVVYANLTKKDLPRGRWRYLEEKEVIQLKHFIK